ncbi:MAG: potassium channel family protein [Woeseia sp.]
MTVEYWLTAATTAVVVTLCTALHYETLRLISNRVPLLKAPPRPRIILLILVLLILHVVEIWLFGAAYYFLLATADQSALVGASALSIVDCVYFSATVFSTVGFGDISPIGPIRFLAGTEAVAGLTFITWSASYTYLVMQNTWKFDSD